MTLELKQYFAEIGKRGGSAKSGPKASAVRTNGALGGRPRKDGMPPGSKPLDDILEWVEHSQLADNAKFDLSIWARQTARLFKDGEPWLNREQVLKVTSMISPRS